MKSPANRELWPAIAAVIALVLFRSIVFLCYEQNFDSDQAIVGLMAKHASEFRALPLFFYGQNYMLGVEAWMAVPFFWLGGATVTMLRLPLLLINVAVVILLIRLLAATGLSPFLAFVAVLPLAACGPVASAQLLTALGASVEPILYVLLLWMLRSRPLPFGMVLCVGSLHREFTMFALPPILLLQWLEHREIRWRPIATASAAFVLTWLAVDQLKRHVQTAGPIASAASAANGSLALEAVQVGRLLSFDPARYFGRLQLLLTQGLSDLFGARRLPLFVGGIWGDGEVGSRLAGVALAVALILCASRLVWIAAHRGARHIAFQIFLLLVSIVALFAYGLHGGTEVEARTELNYVLLVLLLPVALLGAFLRVESIAVYQRAAVSLVAVWALAMCVDTARVTMQYVVSPPPSPHRVLADYLVDHRIKYAVAGYWDAYRVTFLSKERVIVSPIDIVRVPAYQARVDLNKGNAARIVRVPCDEGTRVAEWCVSDPFQR